MPVIINDLEVVIESPAPAAEQQGTSSANQSGSAAIRLTPYDVEVLTRQQRDRIDRIRAH